MMIVVEVSFAWLMKITSPGSAIVVGSVDLFGGGRPSPWIVVSGVEYSSATASPLGGDRCWPASSSACRATDLLRLAEGLLLAVLLLAAGATVPVA